LRNPGAERGILWRSGRHGLADRYPVHRITANPLEHHAIISVVSGDYFQVLGLAPLRGRNFTVSTEEVLHSSPVAIVSYNYWQTHLGQDPAIVGQKLQVRETVYEIVGVAAPGFTGERLSAGLASIPGRSADRPAQRLGLNHRYLSRLPG
jgi:hypothetical protein